MLALVGQEWQVDCLAAASVPAAAGTAAGTVTVGQLGTGLPGCMVARPGQASACTDFVGTAPEGAFAEASAVSPAVVSVVA